MVADHKVCIIMLGESGVGKTALMLRFCERLYRDDTKVTIPGYCYKKAIILNDSKIDLELWDTAGLEKFNTITKEYFRRADGVLLVYDTTRLTTLMKLSNWVGELRELNEEATVLLVGSKADLQHKSREVRRTAEIYAQDEDMDFCETSAKNNENVDEVFENLALKVLERKKISKSGKGGLVSKSVQTESSLPSIIHLEEEGVKPKKRLKDCCK